MNASQHNEIASHSKFAFIAYRAKWPPLPRGEALVLSEECRVLSQRPVWLDDQWTEWLGTLTKGRLDETTMILLYERRAERPGVLNGESEELKRRCQDLLSALLLHGLPELETGMLVVGERQGTKLTLRQVADRLDPVVRLRTAEAARVSPASLQSAFRISESLRLTLNAPAAFKRLKHGFFVWRKAVHEQIPDDRLHQFVRSIDAIAKTRVGSGKSDFKARGQLFIGQSPSSETLLDDLYDLRSCTEHMNDFETALESCAPGIREETAMLRAWQGEVLASETYRRVFDRQEFRECLANDEAIDNFWELPRVDQRAAFGEPIDLDRIIAERRRLQVRED